MFEAVISIFPNSATAHSNYAFCLLPVDPDRALEELGIADTLLPNRPVTIADEMLAFHLLEEMRRHWFLGTQTRS